MENPKPGDRINVLFTVAVDGAVSEVSVAGRLLPHDHAQHRRMTFLNEANGDLPRYDAYGNTVTDGQTISCLGRYYYSLALDARDASPAMPIMHSLSE
jgi:hypothetical protein